MSKTDDLLLETINSTDQLEDGEMVVEAILIYATVLADNPESHGYGKVFLGGSMPHHHTLGLLETAHNQVIDGDDL